MQYRVSEAAAVLSRTPATLRAFLEGLPEAWLHSDEGPGTWSPFQVAGHLAQAEEKLWIPRARTILSRGEDAVFEPFDRFAHLERYHATPLPEVLDRFQTLRRRSLDALSELDLKEEALRRRGRHPDFGTVTVGQLLATWVVHLQKRQTPSRAPARPLSFSLFLARTLATAELIASIELCLRAP